MERGAKDYEFEEGRLEQNTDHAQDIEEEFNPVKRLTKIVGPGVITGASDDDPSGIATYTTTGAQFGYTTLWTALFTLPMMAVVQFICAKVALSTGYGLTTSLRQKFPGFVLGPTLIALFVANAINAGTDIGAIAAAVDLLVPVPITVLVVPIAVGIVALQMAGSYDLIANVFKWLALSLLAYVAAGLLAKPDGVAVLRGTFLPQVEPSSDYVAVLVAVLGTTISPYLFFWQAGQEVEELPTDGVEATPKSVKYAAWDIIAGMVLSNVVMYFVILSTAATLHATGHTDVNSAADAARSLEPIAGTAAKFLLAFGLIGGGLLAIPILTGASAYALAEFFGWEQGMDKKPHEAKGFYLVIVVATAIGVLVNFAGVNPIQALFVTALINGLLAPILLAEIMLISGDKEVLGDRANSTAVSLVGWTTTVVMSLAAVAYFATLLIA